MHRSCLMSIVSLSKCCQNLLFQNKKSFLWYLFLFKRSISVWFRNTTTKSVVKKDVTPPLQLWTVVFDLSPAFSTNSNSLNPCNNLELPTRFDPTINGYLNFFYKFETIYKGLFWYQTLEYCIYGVFFLCPPFLKFLFIVIHGPFVLIHFV